MSPLNSPAKILKLWNKGTGDYLEAKKVKTLEPSEETLNKKICKNLEKLKKMAKTGGPHTAEDAAQFMGDRDVTLQLMGKFRKLFKSRKNQAAVKPFYLKVCKLTVVVEKLQLETLDPGEGEPTTDILDDINVDTLDNAETDQEALSDGAEDQKAPLNGKAPQAPPGPVPQAPALSELTVRLKTLVVNATSANVPGSVKQMVKLNAAKVQACAGRREFDEADKILKKAESLLAQTLQGPSAFAGPTAPAPARDLVLFNARLKVLLTTAIQNQPQIQLSASVKQHIKEAQRLAASGQFAEANAILEDLEDNPTQSDPPSPRDATPAKSSARDIPRDSQKERAFFDDSVAALEKGLVGKLASMDGEIAELVKAGKAAEAQAKTREQEMFTKAMKKVQEAKKLGDMTFIRSLFARLGPLKKLVDADFDKAKRTLTEADYLLDDFLRELQVAEKQQEWEKETARWKDDVKTRLPSYKKRAKMGAGGYGQVFALEDPSQDPKAPKLVLKIDTNDTSGLEEDYYQKIGPHPNIARCFGFQEVDGAKGLVLEQINGGTSAEAIADLNKLLEKGSISEEEYWGTMQFTISRLLETLAYIDSKGVLHHDIKPANIMIDGDSGEPKVVDFGTAKDNGEARRGGTEGYISSDSLTSKASGKGDIFALGASFWEVSQGSTGQDLKNVFKDHRKFAQKVNGKHKEALPVSGQGNEDFEVIDPNTGKKQLGKYGARSAYVDFINQLMHPDADKRLSAADALNHPFLRHRMLDDDAARATIQGVVQQRQNQPPPDRRTLTFAASPAFEPDEWTRTLVAAVQAGAVPEASGLITAVREGLIRYRETHAITQNPGGSDEEKVKAAATAQLALQVVRRGLENLQKKKEYDENPTMKDYLGTMLANATKASKDLEVERRSP